MTTKLQSFCGIAAISYTVFAALPGAHADVISVAASQSGNYAADGIGNINSLGFQNYFVGYSSPSAVAERRNFFIFPTAAFEPLTILSAELVLYLPHFAPGMTTDPGDGYISPDPSEAYRLSATPFSAAEVGDPTNSPGESIPIWASLGTGPLAGAIEVFPTDMGTYLHIPLTALAVIGLNGAGPGSIVMGGRLTSLDPSRPMVLDELVFAFTDMPGSGMFTPPTLLLEVVPAPAASLPLLCGAAALTARRRRATAH
ncbi:MAG: hypothetical protein H7Y88_04270 [Phycisphaerales bacterium]|nr:hypothetical protein [Phycisphaerales bacterium]